MRRGGDENEKMDKCVACPRCGKNYASRKTLYGHVRYIKTRCEPRVADLSVEECHLWVLELPIEKEEVPDKKKRTPTKEKETPTVSDELLERLRLLEGRVHAQERQIKSMEKEIAALRRAPERKKTKPQPPVEIADHLAAEDPAYSSTVAFPLPKEPGVYLGDLQGLIEDLFFDPDRPSTHAWRPGPKKDTTVLSEGKRRWSSPDLLENHLITIVSLAVNRIVNEEVLAGRLVQTAGGLQYRDEGCDKGLKELVHFATTGEWSCFLARKKYGNVDIDRLTTLIRRSGRVGGSG
ncbi:hypothetical protein EBZ80_01225 [bacterium]|nr:hypothetical protein [bacterium]